MKPALLVAVLTAGPARAQWFDILPESMVQPWTPTAAVLPAPDSGNVAEGNGDLRWTPAGHPEIASVRVRVRGAVLRDAAATGISSEAARRALMAALLTLKREHRAPDDPPFYTAESTGGFNGRWVDVAVDSFAQTVRFRQPTAPPPAAIACR